MEPVAAGRGPADARAGPALALWMTLTVVLQGLLWLSGSKERALTAAVEQGAAVVESRTVGEVRDETIRRSIRAQRETLRFWTALALLGDFVFEPLALALRAAAVATCLSGLAALAGRPVRFGAALAECATVQGIWVLGLATRVYSVVAFGGAEVETSLTLALPPGTCPAPLWVALRQVDVFALLGWAALARGGWRRGQVNLAAALLACGLLWSSEAALRTAWTLTTESGMRLMLIPEWVAKP
jgi:hypothetical protein